MLSDKKGMTLIEVLVTLAITMLIMAAVFSFFIGAQRGAFKTRQAADSGQAVEIALTQLRNELAGALWMDSVDGCLKYESVRNGYRWKLMLIDGELIKIIDDNVSTQQVVLARNIDEFTYEIPFSGTRTLHVTVRSGGFTLQDGIYLRNWEGGQLADWHASVWYVTGNRVMHRGSAWKALRNCKGGGDAEPGVNPLYWEKLTLP